MVNFTKVVRATDAVLNCIPGVSAINSAAQALYKVAHRVDTLNPVAPGLKTSIKIHVLSKENSELFLKAIPLLGNLIALIELVLSTLRGFRKDDLMSAIINSKAEVVHLCLGSNPLNNDPARRASLMLDQAAYSSNNETFRIVLDHREWSASDLMDALRFSARNGVANAYSILAFWAAHQRVLGADDTYTAADCAKNFLKEGKADLAGCVLAMLPDATPFYRIEDILLKHSCTERDQGVAGVLTDAQRNALIAKSTTPSLEQLKNYYYLAFGSVPLVDRSAASYYAMHADTLNKLLDRAQLSPAKIGEFIVATIKDDALFTVIESLVAKYEEQLTPRSKVEILRRLLPSATASAASHEKRTQLFISWVGRWKNAISAEARELWGGICYSEETNIGEARIRFADWGDNELFNRYPTVEQLRAVNAQFKRILLETFPGCNEVPQQEAI